MCTLVPNVLIAASAHTTLELSKWINKEKLISSLTNNLKLFDKINVYLKGWMTVGGSSLPCDESGIQAPCSFSHDHPQHITTWKKKEQRNCLEKFLSGLEIAYFTFLPSLLWPVPNMYLQFDCKEE